MPTYIVQTEEKEVGVITIDEKGDVFHRSKWLPFKRKKIKGAKSSAGEPKAGATLELGDFSTDKGLSVPLNGRGTYTERNGVIPGFFSFKRATHPPGVRQPGDWEAVDNSGGGFL